MIKWTLFACGLLAFSATACAQEPSKPAPEPSGKAAPATSAASPLVVSASRKLDLDAKDPKGLLLKLNGPKPGYLRLEWGATRQALVQAMASLSGQPVDGVRCHFRSMDNIQPYANCDTDPRTCACAVQSRYGS